MLPVRSLLTYLLLKGLDSKHKQKPVIHKTKCIQQCLVDALKLADKYELTPKPSFKLYSLS